MKQNKKQKAMKYKSAETQTIETYISKLKPIVSTEIKMRALKKSFRLNYIFYIGVLVSIYLLYRSKSSNKSLLIITISFIFASVAGYLVHAESHRILPAEQLYNNSNSLVKKYKIINWIAIRICKFIDFHPII